LLYPAGTSGILSLLPELGNNESTLLSKDPSVFLNSGNTESRATLCGEKLSKFENSSKLTGKLLKMLLPESNSVTLPALASHGSNNDIESFKEIE
jgi:hypothetical protein